MRGGNSIAGRSFGRLIPMTIGTPARDGRVRWLCSCACGRTTEVREKDLRSGNTQSCGCVMRKAVDDLSGQRFGRWTAVALESVESGRVTRWVCVCDCGEFDAVQSGNLKSGHSTSCGCYSSERATTHGKCWTPEYLSWGGMIQRCGNPKATGYEFYGGRGIRVCPRWRESFPNFLADMGPRPSVACSIDRIDVDGNYEPGNCRWATKSEQNSNRRPYRRVFHDRAQIREIVSEIAAAEGMPLS
jgi:hypothetical protein